MTVDGYPPFEDLVLAIVASRTNAIEGELTRVMRSGNCFPLGIDYHPDGTWRIRVWSYQ